MNAVIGNKHVKIISFSFFLLLMSMACGILSKTQIPETFPNTDIIFSAPDGIGFVNADGSNLSSLAFVAELSYGKEDHAWRPVITADSKTIVAKAADVFMNASLPQALIVWQANKKPTFCDNWLHQQLPLLTKDQTGIYIQFEQGIALYALDSCGTNVAPTKFYEDMQGIFSPDLKYVAYVRQSDRFSKSYIVVKEVNSTKEFIVIDEGSVPSWSFDSKWIAYTGVDGIYIVSVEEFEKPKRILKHLNPRDSFSGLYEYVTYHIPPEPSWSPDGKWLVYHKWLGIRHDDTTDPSTYAIYKLNIETGEEIKILDGGMYPFWRWPVEEP